MGTRAGANKVLNKKMKEGDTVSLILASRATVYDRYAISKRFTAQETAINIVQGHISLLISASEIEELKNGDKTMYSRLASVEMDLNSINLAVSSSEYKDINGVLSAITQAKASISLNAEQIELKVSKNSILSTINQSAEAVTIDANKINLNGVVTANQNFKILTDGSMEAKNGTFDGKIITDEITIKSGKLSINSGMLEINNESYEFACLRIQNGNYRASVYPKQLYIGNGGNGAATQQISHDIYGNGISSTWLNGDMGANLNLYYSCYFRISVGDQFVELYPSSMSTFSNSLLVKGGLLVKGAKDRVVETKSFGTVAQSAYETAEPMFGDLGHGIINDYGECMIFIDPKFAETVSTEYGYYVFITKCGDGDAWVKEKNLDTFTIAGTPGLEFEWEIKAHQKGYERDRLRSVDLQ